MHTIYTHHIFFNIKDRSIQIENIVQSLFRLLKKRLRQFLLKVFEQLLELMLSFQFF